MSQFESVSGRDVVALVEGLKIVLYATERTMRTPTEIIASTIKSYGIWRGQETIERQGITWAYKVRDEINCRVYSLRDFMHFQIVRILTRDLRTEDFMKSKSQPHKYGPSKPYLWPLETERHIYNTTASVVRNLALEFTAEAVARDTEILKRVLSKNTDGHIRRIMIDTPIVDSFVHHTYATIPVKFGKSILWNLLESKTIGHGLYFSALRGKGWTNLVLGEETYAEPEALARRFAPLTKTITTLCFEP